MFKTFAYWLHDDTFALAYSLFLVAVMVLPMVLLSRWYHGNINKTAGGRKLMKRQNASGVSARSMASLGEGVGMMRDISAGRYGEEAKRMQNRVYVYCLAWILAIAALAGPMIYAQAEYPKPDINGQRGDANKQ